MRKEPWHLSFHARPSNTYQSEKWVKEMQALESVGYYGLMSFATREEAQREADSKLAQLSQVASDFKWMAIWFCPYVDEIPLIDGAGTCRYKYGE